MDLTQLGIHALVMHLGMIVFFGSQATAAKVYESKGEPSIADYWRKYPTTSLMAVAGSYAAFLGAYQFDQLNYVAAFGIGFIGDRFRDIAAGVAKKKLGGEP